MYMTGKFIRNFILITTGIKCLLLSLHDSFLHRLIPKVESSVKVPGHEKLHSYNRELNFYNKKCLSCVYVTVSMGEVRRLPVLNTRHTSCKVSVRPVKGSLSQVQPWKRGTPEIETLHNIKTYTRINLPNSVV